MNSLVTSRLGACLFVCLLAAAPARAADRPFVVASQGDAFIAHQARPDISLPDLLRYLPAALVAVRRELNRAGQV